MADTDFAKVKRNVARMAEQGAPVEDIDGYLKTEGLTAMDMRHGGKVDAKEGASWKARAVVGTFSEPAKRLEAIRYFYPDAKSEGGDNFVFTDPATGKKTLFNPEGMDMGDLPGVGREIISGIGATGGAIAGAAGGTVVGPGPGTVAGAAAGAGAGGLYGGKMWDDAVGWLTGVKESPLDRFKTMAADFGFNAVGEGVGASLARVLGPSVSKATGMSGEALSSLAARLGVPLPTRGTAWQNKGLQTLEQGLSNTVGGAQVMEDATRGTLGAMRSKVDQAAGTLGTVHRDQEALGTAALQAAQNSRDRLRAEATKRFDAVYGGIETQPVPGLSETQRYIQSIYDSISDPAEKARFLSDPTVSRALNLATSPDVDVQTLKGVITDMGQKMRPGSAVDTSTASEAQLGGLLKALGLDRDAAVTGLGRGAELQEANRWYSAEKTLRENLESIFGREFKPVDLDLLTSGQTGTPLALNASDVGGQLMKPDLPQNVQQALRAVLGDAEYGNVAATRLARMGDATAGAQGATADPLFSPSTMLTNWNRSLKSGGEAMTPAQWDELMTLTSALKEMEKMANFSGTARAQGVMAMLQGAGATGAGLLGYQQGDTGGAVGGAIGGALLPMLVAKGLVNPRLITKPGAMQLYSRSPGTLSRMLLAGPESEARK